MVFLIQGTETCPQTARKHLQGFVQFSKKQRMHQVRGHLGGRAHVERMRGTPTQARDYCRKDGDYTESGNFVSSGRPKGDPDEQGALSGRGTRSHRRADAFKQLRRGDKTIREMVDDTPDDVAYGSTLSLVTEEDEEQLHDACSSTDEQELEKQLASTTLHDECR